MEMRWYAPVTDGGFLDLLSDLREAGAACTGEHPARCTWRGARFTLIHDVEGPVRAYIDDPGPLGIPGVWALLDPVLLPATHRTGAAPTLGELGAEAWQEYAPRLEQLGQETWQKYGQALTSQPATPSWPIGSAASWPAGFSRGLGQGMGGALPSIPYVGPAMTSAAEEFGRKIGKSGREIAQSIPSPSSVAQEFGRKIGEAGKEIAQAFPIPSVDLGKPAEKIAEALKTAAVVGAVAILGAVAISALARR